MGGSLAAALKTRGFEGRIVACDPSESEIALGIEKGLIEAGGCELAPLLDGVSMIVLAVPVLAMASVLE
ncbi:hypothetical protein, partial [Halomonas sp. 707D4]